MLKRLPERVDPFRLAETDTHLEGSLALSEFKRLCEALLACEGEVEGVVDFGTDEAGTRFLRGKLTAPVRMRCERCLEPVEFTLRASFTLGLVHSQAHGQSLSEAYEPLVVEDARISLREVLEDELLLSLPLVAMHEPSACPATAILERQADEAPAREGENPFAVLAALKKERKE